VSISSVVPVVLVAIANSLPPPSSHAYEVPGRTLTLNPSSAYDLSLAGNKNLAVFHQLSTELVVAR